MVAGNAAVCFIGSSSFPVAVEMLRLLGKHIDRAPRLLAVRVLTTSPGNL
jgi:hypothetical protein